MRITILLAALLLTACREGDAPTGPGAGGVRIFISSDPNGGRILVDGRDTRRLTPDTVPGFVNVHDVEVRLDTFNISYEYGARITVDRTDTTVHTLHVPLVVQCAFATDLSGCYQRLHTYRTAAGMRFATNPLGSLFLFNGQGQGAFWPASLSNSYVASGMPVFAAHTNNVPVALGVYDHAYLAGRPLPRTSSTGMRTTITTNTWAVPPTAAHQSVVTARGLEISEEIVTDENINGVIVIKLRFRNITATPAYQLIDRVPANGITYTDAYIGLMIDPDIGDARDDWLSYDPALDMVFAYDARFSESVFGGEGAIAPALVGLRVLRAPPGTTAILNGYANQSGIADWTAGTTTEPNGFGMLSGRTPYTPDHPNARIGHLPPTEGDMRISVSAGPLTLAPGAEAEIVIAFALAAPTPGTFVSGSAVAPGDPFDVNRTLYRVAAELRQKMTAAAGLIGN